jgi:acyl dehydratase
MLRELRFHKRKSLTVMDARVLFYGGDDRGSSRMKYYEDYEVGTTATVGSFTVTKSEIIDFAEQFDPLWLHTDEERAERESPFGGIIASGWHTLCLCHGLLVQDAGTDSAAIGSPGVEDISWDRPVYPDDTISVTCTVAGKRPSKKVPDRGLITVDVSASNQREQEVLTYRPRMYYLKSEESEKT